MRKRLLEIRWGIIIFLVFLLWMLFEKAMGWHGPKIEEHAIYTNFFYLPFILLYILAIRNKRERHYGGVMSWKIGVNTGLIITGVIVLLSPLGQLIFHNWISPEYFQNARELAVEKGRMSEEEARSFFSLGNYILLSTGGAAFSGIVLSLLIPLFLQSKGKG